MRRYWVLPVILSALAGAWLFAASRPIAVVLGEEVRRSDLDGLRDSYPAQIAAIAERKLLPMLLNEHGVDSSDEAVRAWIRANDPQRSVTGEQWTKESVRVLADALDAVLSHGMDPSAAFRQYELGTTMSEGDWEAALKHSGTADGIRTMREFVESGSMPIPDDGLVSSARSSYQVRALWAAICASPEVSARVDEQVRERMAVASTVPHYAGDLEAVERSVRAAECAVAAGTLLRSRVQAAVQINDRGAAGFEEYLSIVPPVVPASRPHDTGGRL